jgi:ElaB/YqjD/DUF883 family membrane-anchored ribosome-binding protein
MAKALSNRELVPPGDELGPEGEQRARAGREPSKSRDFGPVAVPRSSERVLELPPPAPREEPSAGEKAAAWKQPAAEKIEDLKTRGAEAAKLVRSSAFRAYDSLRAQMVETLQKTRQTSGNLARSLRQRTRYAADEYPIQTLAAIAGVAVICGVLLRMWRSSRYE